MTATGAARPQIVRPPAGGPQITRPELAGAPRLREFVTPEGVDLRLRIGEASERAAAFILDEVFLNVALLVLYIAAAGAAAAFHAKASGAAEVIWTLVSFILSNAYFMVFELTARAATPGKRIMGLRVAARDGGRLTAEAIFARNAMREIEVFLPLRFLLFTALGAFNPVLGWLALLGLGWTTAFALFPLFNRDRLRVGDFVAGTWVVKAPRERLSIDLLDAIEAGRGAFNFSQEQASAYGVKELHVLEDVLRRRDRKTMAAVAGRIRAKIHWASIEGETDVAFLSAYYAALRGRLETRLLFGHRRRDKFDKA
ncbi:MAG: RDD family protein [Caulobacterales bacterium]